MIKRILGSAVALVALLGALSYASIVAPQFGVEVGSAVQSAEQSVKAPNLQLVCPGGAIRSGGASGTRLGEFDQLGSAEINAIDWLRTATLTATSLAGISGQATSASAGMPDRVARPTMLEVDDQSGKLEQGSQLLAASQLQRLDAANFSGLLAAACQQPATDQWFVGGDTTVGREALMVVVNPSQVDAQIDIQAFSNGGVVKVDGLSGLSIPAGRTLVVPLASSLINQATLALHLTASGGSVAAWIQQRVVRGTIPGGSDFIAPATELAKSLVVPGLMLRGQADAAAIIKTRPAYADQTPMLRVFVPADSTGAKRLTVTAQIFGTTAKTFGTVIRETVTTGTATDIPITGLSDGDYVAFVSADRPIRAAIRLPRTNKTKSPATDFAWLQAGESLKGIRAFQVPRSGITRLSLGNPAKTSVEVAIGTPQQVSAGTAPVVSLAGGEVRSIGLTAGALVWLKTSSDAPRANLVIDLDSAVASLSIMDYKNLGSKLQVSVR